MSQQLYALKSKGLPSDKVDNADDVFGESKAVDTVEKDKMVELLKRNHDVMMEKYEVFRQRNELLEQTTLTKEKLYTEIKAENDQIANQLYSVRRQAEDYRQENQILTTKLTTCQTQLKEVQE